MPRDGSPKVFLSLRLLQLLIYSYYFSVLMVLLQLPTTVRVLPKAGIFSTKVQSKHCSLFNPKSVIEARQPPLRQTDVSGGISIFRQVVVFVLLCHTTLLFYTFLSSQKVLSAVQNLVILKCQYQCLQSRSGNNAKV